MKLSREKLVHLSHVVLDALEGDERVKLLADRNDVRLAVLDVLRDAMKREEEIERAVRRKIESQRREIVEGSREWDILFRKYYEDEAAKLRKVR